MTYEEKNRRPELAHHVIADGRERLSISGVEDVESFDEESVVAITSAGVLVVRGSQLHIDKLSLDTGELDIRGWLDAFEYQEDKTQRQGFFKRMFV